MLLRALGQRWFPVHGVNASVGGRIASVEFVPGHSRFEVKRWGLECGFGLQRAS